MLAKYVSKLSPVFCKENSISHGNLKSCDRAVDMMRLLMLGI